MLSLTKLLKENMCSVFSIDFFFPPPVIPIICCVLATVASVFDAYNICIYVYTHMYDVLSIRVVKNTTVIDA